MFWKKKTTKRPLLNLPDDNELREAFRISPEDEQPVLLFVGTTQIEVSNISIGGLAFTAKGFNVGKRCSIRLQLPQLSTPLHCKMEIISCDKNQLCRCQFIDLSEMSLAKVQQYVLGREKQQIRATGIRPALDGGEKHES